MDHVVEALKQFFGEYVVATAILIVALIVFVWWLSAKYHSMKAKVNNIDDLPCKAHEQTLNMLSRTIEENTAVMTRIEPKLDDHEDNIRKLEENENATNTVLARLENTLQTLPCSEHGGLLKEHLKRIEKSDALLTRIESKLEALPCSAHADRHDTHEKRMNESDALLHKMEGQLELLVSNSIGKSNKKIRNHSGYSFSAKHSPRVLNENGISLLQDCGGNEFLKQYTDYFISKIETLKPKTALDVEELALAVLQTSTSDDMFIPIKNWVYNAPMRELHYPDGTSKSQEITLEDILFVMSIPLRDRYLEKNPL